MKKTFLFLLVAVLLLTMSQSAFADSSDYFAGMEKAKPVVQGSLQMGKLTAATAETTWYKWTNPDKTSPRYLNLSLFAPPGDYQVAFTVDSEIGVKMWAPDYWLRTYNTANGMWKSGIKKVMVNPGQTIFLQILGQPSSSYYYLYVN